MLRSALLAIWIFALAAAGCRSEPAPQTSSSAADLETRSLMRQAEQAFSQRNHSRALALLDSARRRSPGVPDVHFARGRVLSALQRYDEAEAAFRKTLDIDPERSGVWFNLGNDAMKQGRHRKALSFYQKELDQRQEQPAGSKQRVLYLQIGRAHEHLGQAEEARRAYLQALRRDSTYALAHRDLSHLYQQQGQYAEALEHAEAALALDPDNPDYRFRVGLSLLQTGRVERAVEMLKQVVEKHPRHYGALSNLGKAYVRLGREGEAQQYLARADSAQRLAHQISQAEASARRYAGEPARWARLGGLLLQAQRYRDAVNAFRHAVRLEPSDAEVWTQLGTAYEEAGRRAAARRAWKQALRHDPDHPAAASHLSRTAE